MKIKNSFHNQHLIITGATGYIGQVLLEIAIAKGFSVSLLGRSIAASTSTYSIIDWSIGEPLPSVLFSDLVKPENCAIIHLAHDWTYSESQETNINIVGTEILLSSSKNLGVNRFVFASSQSARINSINVYGRVKWSIEEMVTKSSGVSARIGLVYGGKKLGMYGKLVELTSLPILPILNPRSLVQPIHILEVCEGLLTLSQTDVTGYKFLADPKTITFSDFLKRVSLVEHGKKLLIIPIPLKIALIGASLTKYIPFLPTIDKEKVLGLAGAVVLDSESDTKELGLIFGNHFDKSATSKGSRGLLIEGTILLTYVLGKKPSSSLLRRYVSGVQINKNKSNRVPIGLPFWVKCFPLFMFIAEPTNKNSILGERLELACLLAEFSHDGGKVFFNSKKQNKYLLYIDLFIRILVDIILKSIRAVLSRKGNNEK